MQPFTYQRAASWTEASRIAAGDSPSPSFLAGGTTLLDLMKLEVLQPRTVIDITPLAEAHGDVTATPQGLRLGALARMDQVAEHPAVRDHYPVIAQSLQLAASPQIRHMATLGGNVLQRTRCGYFRDPSWPACNKRRPGSGCGALRGVNRKHAVLGTSAHCIATYPGDFAQALIALDATVEIGGAAGPYSLPFAALHRLPGDEPQRETALAPGDLLLGFVIPAAPWARRSLYLKVRDRTSYDFAAASAAVALDLEGERVREARIALGGVATKPWRATEAESLLRGRILDEAVATRAAEAAFAAAVTQGGNDDKPELGRRTLVRALLQAAELEV